MDILRDFQKQISAGIRGDKPAPDVFDLKAFPFGAPAGDNKCGFAECATCGKPPTKLQNTTFANQPDAFLFRDLLSAKEYRISGMCQACQDSVFNCPDDEEECGD